jgi:hypothetical protein
MGVPLLACKPELLSLSTKTGGRNIFEKCSIKYPKVIFKIFEFIESLQGTPKCTDVQTLANSIVDLLSSHPVNIRHAIITIS